MIVAGFGFRADATVDSLRDAYHAASDGFEVTRLATLDDKAHAPAFAGLTQELGVAYTPVLAEYASATQTITQSEYSKTARATGSVAEATALVAAGPGARLIKTRVVSRDGMATCALARSTFERGHS